jgi:hypothetical protein
MSGKQGAPFIYTATWVVLLFLLRTGQASGQCDMTDPMIRERLETIQRMFDKGKVNANRWWNGWLIGYGAATVIQSTTMLVADDLSTRQDLALGAATTLLGAAGQLVTPDIAGHAADRIREIPGNTREEMTDKLTEAEGLLKECALQEKKGRSWKTHALYGIVNLGSGFVTWIGFDRNFKAGLGNFALNMVISETQLWTQPSKAISDYDNYRKKYDGCPEEALNRYNLSWSVNASPGRITLRIIF